MLKKRESDSKGNMTDFPLYLYHHGKNDRIYEIFGAHKQTRCVTAWKGISSASGHRMRAVFPW